VLETANMILCWKFSVITGKRLHFKRTDTVLIDTDNKTALVIDIAILLTHILPKTEAEKI
jgi:hypothetical protein